MINSDDEDAPRGPLGMWSFPILSAVKRRQDAEAAALEAKAHALRQPRRDHDDDEDGLRPFNRKNHIY
jgi:hypothetical protein